MTTPVLSLKAWISIALWMILGYCMIFFNKMLFSTMDFAYPYFLTMWHCIFATICTQILVRTTNWLPGVKDAKVTATVIISKVMPLSLCFAFSLVCGNTAYKYLSVAYIQMIKSMTPVLMLLIAFLIGRERMSFLQLSIVGMISGGVAIASAGELHFSTVGVTLQLAAMVADCCRITLLETVLADFKLDSLSMLYYLSPASAFLIALGFVLREFETFPFERLDGTFCTILFLNATVAFALNLSIFFVISNATGMIMSIAGLAKDIIVVVTSSMFFHAPVTAVQYGGYGITIAGMFIYKEYKQDPVSFANWANAKLSSWPSLLSTGGGSSLGIGHGGSPKAKNSDNSLADCISNSNINLNINSSHSGLPSGGQTAEHGGYEYEAPSPSSSSSSHSHHHHLSVQQRVSRRDNGQQQQHHTYANGGAASSSSSHATADNNNSGNRGRHSSSGSSNGNDNDSVDSAGSESKDQQGSMGGLQGGMGIGGGSSSVSSLLGSMAGGNDSLGLQMAANYASEYVMAAARKELLPVFNTTTTANTSQGTGSSSSSSSSASTSSSSSSSSGWGLWWSGLAKGPGIGAGGVGKDGNPDDPPLYQHTSTPKSSSNASSLPTTSLDLDKEALLPLPNRS